MATHVRHAAPDAAATPKLDVRPRLHRDAVVQRVGTALIAATGDDRLHVFEGPDGAPSPGERIVELIDGVRSVRGIARILSDEFDGSAATIERDTLSFVEELVARRIAVLSPLHDARAE